MASRMVKLKLREDEAFALVAVLNSFRERLVKYEMKALDGGVSPDEIRSRYTGLFRMDSVAEIVIEQCADYGVDASTVEVA